MHPPTLRVLDILELLAQRGEPLRLTDFSKVLEIPKSTLLPILQTLCQRNYLHQDSAGLYTAGTALFSIGTSFSGCFPVLDYVNNILAELAQQLQETCYFGALENGQVLYLGKQDSPQPLRVLTDTGRRMPAYATSLGKALLMDHDQEKLQDLYPGGLTALTPNTITDPTILAAQLAQARSDGYTWEIEESTAHIRCFAVPVRKHSRIIAAISVAIPLFRYEEANKPQILAALQEQAAKISRIIEQTDAHFGALF